MMNFMNTWLKIWKKLAIIFLSIFVIDIMAVFLYYYRVQGFISDQTFQLTADAGVVFFGDYDWSAYELGKDTKQRLKHTIHLYQSERINRIICIGGARANRKFLGSKEMRNYLTENGIDAEKILYDSLSYDTKTNWYEASKIIDRNQFTSIVIISSPLHVYRISKIIDRNNTYFSAYTYHHQTISDYFSTYTDIHHEWSAFLLSAILPERIYLKMVYWQRN